MADYTLAQQVKPLDVGSALMTADRINASRMEQQKALTEMRQVAAGQFARGVAVYADKPEFAAKWAQGMDDLNSQGMIDTAQYQKMRNSPSSLVLQQIIAQTSSPEFMFRQEEAKRAQANTERSFGLQQQQFEELKRAHAAGEEKPVSVAPGAMLVSPKTGEKVAENKGGAFDFETVTAMADQYLTGDKTVFQNLGRGAQGAENVIALRKRVQERALEMGMKPADIAQRLTDFQADAAGTRTVAVIGAKIEYASNTANRAIDIAREAMARVPRTQYLPLNKLVQAYNTQTSSPEQAAAYAAVNTLVQEYARVVSPTGVPTEGTREHARQMLNTAMDQKAFNAVLDMMRKEIESAKAALKDTRQELRTHGAVTGNRPEGNLATTPPNAAPPASSLPTGIPPPPPGFTVVPR